MSKKAPTTLYPRELKEGMWARQPAFILGGGPSLKGFNFDSLRGQNTIGTNRTYETYDPCINVSLDVQFVNMVMRGEYGVEAKEKYLNTRCLKVLGGNKPSIDCDYKEAYHVLAIGKPQVGNFEVGIAHHGNSGAFGLNLALVLGADPIYLLGFDMSPGWYHSGHLKETGPNAYKRYMERISKAEVEYSSKRIINLNPKSALTTFPFGSYEDLPVRNRPLIVCFHTTDPFYTDHAERMAKSAHLFGFQVELHAVDLKEHWDVITRYKATFLKEMLLKHNAPIIWMDADSRMVEYTPKFEEFASSDAEVGICWSSWEELNTGVMALKPTQVVYSMLDAWIDKNAHTPLRILEQRVLQNLYDAGEFPGLKVMPFSESFVKMYDCRRQENTHAIIMQLQASRVSRGSH
jgi:hypothetical protein